MSNEDLESLKKFAIDISAKAEAARATDLPRVASQDRQHAMDRWQILQDVIKDEIYRITTIKYQIGVELKLKKLVMGHNLFGSYAVTAKSMDANDAVMGLFQYDKNCNLIIQEIAIRKSIGEVKREPAKIIKETLEDIRGVLNSITRTVMAFRMEKAALDQRPKLAWKNSRLAENVLIVDVESVRL